MNIRQYPHILFIIFAVTAFVFCTYGKSLNAGNTTTPLSSVVTVQASGSQLFKTEFQPILVPNPFYS